MNAPPLPRNVAEVFDRFPKPVRDTLMSLRTMLFASAARHQEIGPLREDLKWGQPSYAPKAPRIGTPVRIDADATNHGDVALYVNCQTNLVEGWRDRYPDLSYGTTRSVHFRAGTQLPEGEIAHMVAEALTYHARNR